MLKIRPFTLYLGSPSLSLFFFFFLFLVDLYQDFRAPQVNHCSDQNLAACTSLLLSWGYQLRTLADFDPFTDLRPDLIKEWGHLRRISEWRHSDQHTSTHQVRAEDFFYVQSKSRIARFGESNMVCGSDMSRPKDRDAWRRPGPSLQNTPSSPPSLLLVKLRCG